jgi:hypothetical protein
VVEFNGDFDVLVTPGLTVQEKVPILTFATWIKPREENFDSGLRSLISHKVVPWVDGTIHFMISGRSLQLSVKFDGGLSGTTEFEADKWYHVAVVRDANDMITYVNGEEDARRVDARREITFSDGFNIGAHANASRQFYGRMEDIRIYDHALTAEELLAIALAPFPKLELATGPNPVNGQTNTVRDVQLTWTPGEGADQHDVYFGTNIDDVNNAGTTNDPTSVYTSRQEATTYTPGLLEFGQTYYWRVDEVKTADGTISKGPVWEFTTEPVGYALPGELITTTASSSADPNGGPVNTVNGSGLDDNDLHSVDQPDMWLSSAEGPQPTWIQYEFDKVYKLHEMLVWNHNSFLERVVGFGIKEAVVEYSADGTSWTTVGTTHEFARADSAAGYAANTTIDLSGVIAKYVKITANNNWGSLPQYGLSEVRFLYVPVRAREPDPASGAKDIDVANVALRWRAGREAALHDVYLGTDEQTVIDETISPAGIPAGSGYTSYDAGTLDLAQTYYWKVNEVNQAQIPANWQGDVSSFSTRDYLVVENFEPYNDLDPTDPESNRIFNTWIDGLDQPVNASVVGYANAPFAEPTIVYEGKQSMPLSYYNTTATYSEATVNIANLQIGQDWTKSGIKTLSLWFYGDPNNAAEQMYAKLNGSKVAYDSDVDNLARIKWQAWNINLADFGTNLSNVTELSIGFERSGAVGGAGLVLFDNIILTPFDRQLITPVDPGTTGLQAHYEFEGNTDDSSGNSRHGTATGGPIFTAGKVGQAINLDGVDDYVEITGYKGVVGDGIETPPWTVTAWVRTNGNGEVVGWGSTGNGNRMEFRINDGRARAEGGGGNTQGDTTINDGSWHHIAVTVRPNSVYSSGIDLWLDGLLDTRSNTDPDPWHPIANQDVKMGIRYNGSGRQLPCVDTRGDCVACRSEAAV